MVKEKKVFLITSCDSSYKELNHLVSVIVQDLLKYKLIISERDIDKDGQILLNTIYNSIKESNFILIDVIPDNFNIAFEAGIAYTFREEILPNKKILFLVPQYLFDENTDPVDICGIKLTPFGNSNEYKNKILDFFDVKAIKRDIEDNLNAIVKLIPSDIRLSKLIKNKELYISSKNKIKVPVYNINGNNSIYNNLTLFINNNCNSKIELTKIIISSDFPFLNGNNNIILLGKSYSLNDNKFNIQLESPITIANDQELELMIRFMTNSKIEYRDKYDFCYILNTLQGKIKIEDVFTIFTEIILH